MIYAPIIRSKQSFTTRENDSAACDLLSLLNNKITNSIDEMFYFLFSLVQVHLIVTEK